ncbi:MAG: VanZ family protein [Gammaproteobacteria bacterium]|nr:VanZ family protein [Gammaproteobacteria bacterium]
MRQNSPAPLLPINRFRFFLLWLLIGWALVAVVLFLSLTPSPPEVLDFTFADKLEHLLAYSVLMGLFGQLYGSLRQQLLWALGFCLMGIALEFAQGWGGHRFFDVADMAANTLGVLLGWWLVRRWLAGSLLTVDAYLARYFSA